MSNGENLQWSYKPASGANGFLRLESLREFISALEVSTQRKADIEIEAGYIAAVLVLLHECCGPTVAELGELAEPVTVVGALAEEMALNLGIEDDRRRLIELVTEAISPTVDELNSEVSR